MKRLLPVALMLFVSSPVLAGDIQNPGVILPPPPPPCTENCTTTTATAPTEISWTEWVLLLLPIVRS